MQPSPQPGAPAPQQGPSQGAPQSQPQGGGGQSPAAQAVGMIQHGYQILGQIVKSAGHSIDPQTMQIIGQATKVTEAMIQHLSGPAEAQAPAQAPQGPKGPMPEHAGPGAKPAY